jgi:hypothetical protein
MFLVYFLQMMIQENKTTSIMKKHITKMIGMLLLVSVIGSLTSCSVEYRERHHHDYHHDDHYDHDHRY